MHEKITKTYIPYFSTYLYCVNAVGTTLIAKALLPRIKENSPYILYSAGYETKCIKYF